MCLLSAKAHKSNKIENLAHQFAALQVVETLRCSTRLPLPSGELVDEFEHLACEIMGRKMSHFSQSRECCTNNSGFYYALGPTATRMGFLHWEMEFQRNFMGPVNPWRAY